MNSKALVSLGMIAAAAGAALWYFRHRDSQVSVYPVPDTPTPLQPDIAQPGGWTTPGINSLFDLASPQGTTASLLNSLLGTSTVAASAPGAGTSPFDNLFTSADTSGTTTGYVMKQWTTPKLGDVVNGETVIYDGQRWEPLFQDASAKYAIPPGVLSRLAWQESRYNPTAISIVGAQGMMQIMPSTLPSKSISDLQDPNKAIYYAASILADNYRQLLDWPKAIVAYNQGAGNVRKAIANATAKGDAFNWLNYPPIGPDGRGYIAIATDTGLWPSLVNPSAANTA